MYFVHKIERFVYDFIDFQAGRGTPLALCADGMGRGETADTQLSTRDGTRHACSTCRIRGFYLLVYLRTCTLNIEKSNHDS